MRKWLKMTPPVFFLGEILTRPCEVWGKVILDLLRFWAPMRLALDTGGGVSRKPIIMAPQEPKFWII